MPVAPPSLPYGSPRRARWPVLLAAGILASAQAAYAEPGQDDSPAPVRPPAEPAFRWELVYKADVLGRLSGTGRRFYGLDNLDLRLWFDGANREGWEGITGLLYLLGNHGSKPGAALGRLPAGMDNIETPAGANTVKLYQAWLTARFATGHASVLVGLYDFNSEFYSTEGSGIFLLPTFGIGTEAGISGRNGPSIFPTTSLAARLKIEPAGPIYAQFAVFDGVPGDPANPHGTHVQLSRGDGALLAAEAGENPPDGAGTRWGVGGWRYTARVPDLVDRNPDGTSVARASWGVYALLDVPFGSEADPAGRRAFVRLGRNDGDTVQFSFSAGAGVSLKAPIAGRENDQVGVAVAWARNADKFRRSDPLASAGELTFEATWRARITSWLSVQPDLQYVAKAATRASPDRTWYGGARFEFAP